MSEYEIYEGGDANMTSLQGYVKASYDDLVDLFGEPTYTGSGDDKVDFEWVLTIEGPDGADVATIYNWKDYDNGLEAQSNPFYNWHIGGHTKLVVAAIQEYLDEKVIG